MSVPAIGTRPRPAAGWYAAAALVAVAALGAAGAFVYHRVTVMTARLIHVVVPGEAELSLDEPGSYTIFHEYRSVINGKVYYANRLSGLRVTLRAPDGGRVALKSPSATSRYSISNRAGVSVFAFEAAEPGTYRLAASYEDGRRTPQTVLAIGTGFVRDIIMTVVATLTIMFGGVGIAIAVAAITYRARKRARLAGAPPP